MFSKKKRLFDLIIAVLALTMLSPVFLILVILVRTKLGSPVLFIQTRPGYKGVPFKMYKFRTMTNDRDAAGDLLDDEVRLTRFGQFLRSTSLDELPELWNVLKGEMSLVGPRPLLMEYLALYNDEQMRRHDCPPGITGWAQVNGRNAITWDKKFQLDTWYLDNWSVWLDIKIIIKTIEKVVARKDISADSHVTADKFRGKKR